MSYPDFSEFSGLFLSLREELQSRLPEYRAYEYLLAVSGGADSLFLSYFFIWLRKRDSVAIRLLHFNHHLRPQQDEREAQYLRNFAKEWQIPYEEAEADISQLAERNKCGIEEMARCSRHNFFREICQKQAALNPQRKSFITLGHNADDLLETILLNLARGSGLRGLSAMPYSDEDYLRPILGLRGEAIRSFMRERELPYFVDSSNQSPIYLRNRLRNELIPLWQEILAYDPAASIYRMSQSLNEENTYLEELSCKALEEVEISTGELNLKRLCKLPKALHYRILDLAISSFRESTKESSLDINKENALSYKQYQMIQQQISKLPCEAEIHLANNLVLTIKAWKAYISEKSK